MKQKRKLTVTVQGKSPNTVTLGITHSTTVETAGEKKTESVTTADDFPIGSALHEAVSSAVTGFIEDLQEDEGPNLFEKKKEKA